MGSRNISEANRLLQDLIEYSNKNNLTSSIIFIDYMKAFDRVEWEWTIKCLDRFNFGAKFQSWIKMIFKNAKTSIMTNGFRSKYFQISRSMRQGCPISPLLYILQAEPFACAIRKNDNIIGIHLPYNDPESGEQATVKLVSYVDDAQFFNSSEESIRETFRIAEKYEKASGAKIHKTKTVGLYLGAWRNKNPTFKEISWTKGYVKTLGIQHGYDIDENEVWMEKVNKIKSCIQIWKSRDLSYIGRVLIIKTLLASQIGYLAEIKTVPHNIIKQIESLIWNFLWNNKHPLVNRKTMHLNLEEGGVKMLNLKNFIEAKRIHFIYKMIKAEYQNWNIIGKQWLKVLDEEYDIENFILKCTDIKGLNLGEIPQYYQECIKSWVKFHSILTVRSKKYILGSPLYGNKYIKHRNSPIFLSNFSKSNVKYVRDIWNAENDSFLPNESIRDRLLDRTNYAAKYNKIKASFSPDILEILNGQNTQLEPNNATIDTNLNICMGNKVLEPNKLKLKFIQKIILDKNFERKFQTKWETAFDENFQWKQIWQTLLEIPVSNREKQFQWKIIHNAIFTEHKLFLMNMSDGLCHFCRENSENLTHLFYFCRIINRVIRELEQKINSIIEEEYMLKVQLNPTNLILGFVHEKSDIRMFVNFVLIQCKWEIWKLRNKIKHDNKYFTFQMIIPPAFMPTGI